jgi:hypothetical protein
MVGGWGWAPMMLAAQADDRASPLRRYLDACLPALGVMHGPLAGALAGAVTVRPPGLGPSPMMLPAYWAEIENAVNYRLRLALAADVGLAPAHGIARLMRSTQTPWPVLNGGSFQRALANFIHEVRQYEPAVPLPLPDPAQERRACQFPTGSAFSTRPRAPAGRRTCQVRRVVPSRTSWR